MIVGALLLCLRLSGVTSIKDKRRIIRGMIERLKLRYGVSAAEVGDLGLLGNAEIGVSVVANSKAQAESVLRAAQEFVESHPEVEVFDFRLELDALE